MGQGWGRCCPFHFAERNYSSTAHDGGAVIGVQVVGGLRSVFVDHLRLMFSVDPDTVGVVDLMLDDQRGETAMFFLNTDVIKSALVQDDVIAVQVLHGAIQSCACPGRGNLLLVVKEVIH